MFIYVPMCAYLSAQFVHPGSCASGGPKHSQHGGVKEDDFNFREAQDNEQNLKARGLPGSCPPRIRPCFGLIRRHAFDEKVDMVLAALELVKFSGSTTRQALCQ